MEIVLFGFVPMFKKKRVHGVRDIPCMVFISVYKGNPKGARCKFR